eukprot:1161889-Pelagomonas_calceolata.AAC.6
MPLNHGPIMMVIAKPRWQEHASECDRFDQGGLQDEKHALSSPSSKTTWLKVNPIVTFATIECDSYCNHCARVARAASDPATCKEPGIDISRILTLNMEGLMFRHQTCATMWTMLP